MRTLDGEIMEYLEKMDYKSVEDFYLRVYNAKKSKSKNNQILTSDDLREIKEQLGELGYESYFNGVNDIGRTIRTEEVQGIIQRVLLEKRGQKYAEFLKGKSEAELEGILRELGIIRVEGKDPDRETEKDSEFGLTLCEKAMIIDSIQIKKFLKNWMEGLPKEVFEAKKKQFEYGRNSGKVLSVDLPEREGREIIQQLYGSVPEQLGNIIVADIAKAFEDRQREMNEKSGDRQSASFREQMANSTDFDGVLPQEQRESLNNTAQRMSQQMELYE